MTYNNNTHVVEVLKVDDLPFLILLGRDAPTFGALIRAALRCLTAVLQEDEPTGPV